MPGIFQNVTGDQGINIVQHFDLEALGGGKLEELDRQIMRAARREKYKTPGGEWYRNAPDSEGALSGFGFWPRDKKSGRKLNQYQAAYPALSSSLPFVGPDGKGGAAFGIFTAAIKKITAGTPKAPGGLWETDGTLSVFHKVHGPPGLGYPIGTPFSVLHGTSLEEDVPVAFPAFIGLVAPYFAGPGFETVATPVWDVDPATGSYDFAHWSDILTHLRVFTVPAPLGTTSFDPPAGPTGHGVALRLDHSGDDVTINRIGLWSDLAHFDSGPETLCHPSSHRMGPFHGGSLTDKHLKGATKDKEKYNPLHIDVHAFYSDARFFSLGAVDPGDKTSKDGPIDFDLVVLHHTDASGPFLVPAHIRWSEEGFHVSGASKAKDAEGASLGGFFPGGGWLLSADSLFKTAGDAPKGDAPTPPEKHPPLLEDGPPTPGGAGGPPPAGSPPPGLGPFGSPPGGVPPGGLPGGAGPGGPGKGPGIGGGAGGAGGVGGIPDPGDQPINVPPKPPKKPPPPPPKRKKGWKDPPGGGKGYLVGPDGGLIPLPDPSGLEGYGPFNWRTDVHDPWDDTGGNRPKALAQNGDLALRYGWTSMELACPGVLGKPQRYDKSAPDLRNDPRPNPFAIWDQEWNAPIVGREEFRAYQIDGGFPYTQDPTSSRYPCGTASGAKVISPPEIGGERDTTDRGDRPALSEYGQVFDTAYIAFASWLKAGGIENGFKLDQPAANQLRLRFYPAGTQPSAQEPKVQTAPDGTEVMLLTRTGAGTGTAKFFGVSVGAGSRALVALGDAGVNPAVPATLYVVTPSVNRNIVLPAGSGRNGQEFGVKNFGASTAKFTLTAGGDNIEGNPTLTVNPGQTVWLMCDGAVNATFVKSGCC